VGLSIVVSISTPYIRSHLGDLVTPHTVMLILEKTETIRGLSVETATQVRTVFGEAYNIQMKVLIGFAAVKIPITALMWTNQKSDT
jgi:hypothetical protein